MKNKRPRLHRASCRPRVPSPKLNVKRSLTASAFRRQLLRRVEADLLRPVQRQWRDSGHRCGCEYVYSDISLLLMTSGKRTSCEKREKKKARARRLARRRCTRTSRPDTGRIRVHGDQTRPCSACSRTSRGTQLDASRVREACRLESVQSGQDGSRRSHGER